MPQLSSPISTPAGMPAKNPAHIGKNAGEAMHYATRAAWLQAVASSLDTANWPDGQPMTIADEADSGAVRIWRVSLGHARTVRLGLYLGVMSVNTAAVLTASGIPESGTGTDGDWSFDPVTSVIYAKSGGLWQTLGTGDGSPVVQPAKAGAYTVQSSDRKTVVPFSATGTPNIPLGVSFDRAYQFEIVNNGEFNTVLSSTAGVTLVSGGTVVSTITITKEGSSLLIRGSGTPNKFYVDKLGA